MAAPIALGGLGTGMDTSSIVTQLVNASSGNLQNMQARATELRSAVSTLSDIGRALSSLHTATAALASLQAAGCYSATSSDSAVVAKTTGDAQPGSYQVTVGHLATEQRTYSAAFSSSTGALNQTGTLTLSVGGKSADVSVLASDSLQGVADKINVQLKNAGARASAGLFFDGGQYRLQIRGLDTGKANAITFVENGTSFDLNGTGALPTSGRTVQAADDAALTVDGLAVTSATNQVAGAIPGITLTLAQPTSSPLTVNVGSDSKALSDKISAVVSAYNSVVQASHTATGYGTQQASNPMLAGDSALRMVTHKLSATVLNTYGSGQYSTMGMVGISISRDGTLSLDQTKLANALATDPGAVQSVLGRATGATNGGAMATLEDLTDSLTASTTGTLAVRQASLTSEASRLDDSATAEQTRLDAYRDSLQKQFSAMETSYAASQQLMAQLTKQFG